MQHNTICRHKYFRDEQCSFLIKTFNLMNLYFTLQSFLNDTIQCVLLMQWATYSKNGESWDEKYTLSYRIMPGTWKRPWRMQFFPTYVFENPLVGKICPAVQHRWNNSSWKKTSYLVYSHPVNRPTAGCLSFSVKYSSSTLHWWVMMLLCRCSCSSYIRPFGLCDYNQIKVAKLQFAKGYKQKCLDGYCSHQKPELKFKILWI